jgi:hypothetical protein
MKLPAAARGLIAGVSKGAIVLDDGELYLPPSVVPVLVCGTPVDESNGAGNLLEQSHFGQVGGTRAGIQAAIDFDSLQIFGKGMWHIQGTWMFQFAGTQNNLNSVNLRLTNKDASQAPNSLGVYRIYGANLAVQIEYWLALRVDGVRFRLSFPATVAGDALASDFSYLANKLF